MPVPVVRIVDRHLVIDITDPKLQEALAPLNTNGDDRINIDDFQMTNPKAAVPESVRRDAMHHAVVDIFLKNNVISEIQSKGMLRFFNLYNNAKEAASIVENWKRNNIDTWGKELEFKAGFWKAAVLPHVRGNGVLSARGRGIPSHTYCFKYSRCGVGLGLSTEAYYVIHNLTHSPADRPPIWACTDVIYNVDDIPPIVRDEMRQLTRWLHSIYTTLKPYRQIECDDAGCPTDDEYSFRLIRIEPGPATTDKVYCYRR